MPDAAVTSTNRPPSLRSSRLAHRGTLRTVEIAVAVVIDPRGLAGDAIQGDAEAAGHVDEARAALVAIHLGRDLRVGEPDEQIRIAVGIEITPGRRARFLVVGKSDVDSNVAERALVVAIEAIGPASERDEVIKITVAVRIGPGVGLASRRGEQFGLHQLECRPPRRGLAKREQRTEQRDKAKHASNHSAIISWMAVRIVAIALAGALTGCALANRVGVTLLYRKADLPATQIFRDLCYLQPSPCDGPDQTLDLYVPITGQWPVIVFVHGGGWDSGDKDFRAGGADVYANVGRFFAARGIAVAVINYRLQPRVTWSQQVEDVRMAVSWVRSRALAYGGQPERIFLMGHSAGTHLASVVALTASPDMRAAIRGVIAVSGRGWISLTKKPINSARIARTTLHVSEMAIRAMNGSGARRRCIL